MQRLHDILPAWFVAGGPIMWPILACSVVTVLVVVEKLWALRERAVLQPDVAEAVKVLARSGHIDEASRHCASHPGPFADIAAAALEAAPYGRDEIRQSVVDAGRHEGARLLRHLAAVRTVAAISPLMGLLGTVTGLLSVFEAVSHGGVGDPARLSSGIREALFTTVFGLAVAIPSLVAHQTFTGRVDRLLLRMERDIIELVSHLTRRGGRPGAGEPARSAVREDVAARDGS